MQNGDYVDQKICHNLKVKSVLFARIRDQPRQQHLSSPEITPGKKTREKHEREIDRDLATVSLIFYLSTRHGCVLCYSSYFLYAWSSSYFLRKTVSVTKLMMSKWFSNLASSRITWESLLKYCSWWAPHPELCLVKSVVELRNLHLTSSQWWWWWWSCCCKPRYHILKTDRGNEVSMNLFSSLCFSVFSMYSMSICYFRERFCFLHYFSSLLPTLISLI